MTTLRRRGGPGALDELPPSPAALIRATWTRPVATYLQGIDQTLATMPPAAPVGTRPLVTVVVDPDDTAGFARAVAALACRRAGRAVVHTNPRQGSVWTLGIDVLSALGKHWDRVGQGCDISIGPLVEVWLRAEQIRDLIVLRAHQVTGSARAWLLDLAGRERLRLWLCAPDRLGDLDPVVPRVAPGALLAVLRPHRRCHCEDLNRPAPLSPANAAPPRLTPATGRLLRRLHDPEAAALAAVMLMLGRPDPVALAIAQIRVARNARYVTTTDGRTVQVPEHARGLLRCRGGWPLLPPSWAPDVAAAYLLVRLEAAGRHVGLALVDPNRPPDPPEAWQLRTDRGAALLQWLIQGDGLFRAYADRTFERDASWQQADCDANSSCQRKRTVGHSCRCYGRSARARGAVL